MKCGFECMHSRAAYSTKLLNLTSMEPKNFNKTSLKIVWKRTSDANGNVKLVIKIIYK